MTAAIPVAEGSLPLAEGMILSLSSTHSICHQGHLHHKFTCTSRRSPAPPRLLKLLLKSSQPRQTGLESDWKTLKSLILSGVQMPLWTPRNTGGSSHPPSTTTTRLPAAEGPPEPSSCSTGLCTCQFWFQCLNSYSESISMKIVELSYRISDPFFTTLFNSVQERNDLWPNRIKEGVQLLQRLSAASAAEQESEQE